MERTKFPEHMPRKLAAEYLGIAPHTLAVWATTARYLLPYIKVGSKVFYSKAVLDAFLESRTVGGAHE